MPDGKPPAWAKDIGLDALVAVEVGWELAELWDVLRMMNAQPDSRGFVQFLKDAGEEFQAAYDSDDPGYWDWRGDYMDCLLAWTGQIRSHVKRSGEMSLPNCNYRPAEAACGETERSTVSRKFNNRPPTAEAVLADFTNTVETTGGISYNADGTPYPEADPDWIDLASCYEKACAALGRKPKVGDDRRGKPDGGNERFAPHPSPIPTGVTE